MQLGINCIFNKTLNSHEEMKRFTNFKFFAMAMFVALLGMSLTACSDDDDDAPAVNNPTNPNPTDSTTVNPNPTDTINCAIVGSWKMEYPYDDAYDGGTDAGTIVEVYTFNSNGTAKYTYTKNNRNGEPIERREIDFTYQYNYNDEEGKGTLTGSYNGETFTYTTKIIENKLYVNDGRGTMEFTRVL